MAVEIIDDVEHKYAPNPKLQGEHWEAEYPPIQTPHRWLINKFTGELFPNTVEFARRSDILEPYEGEPTKEDLNSLVHQDKKSKKSKTDEMVEL